MNMTGRHHSGSGPRANLVRSGPKAYRYAPPATSKVRAARKSTFQTFVCSDSATWAVWNRIKLGP